MIYIGGLTLDTMPCNCNAPFAETGVDENGVVHVTLWRVQHPEENNGSIVLYNGEHDDLDDLNMVCTRCGWHL